MPPADQHQGSGPSVQVEPAAARPHIVLDAFPVEMDTEQDVSGHPGRYPQQTVPASQAASRAVRQDPQHGSQANPPAQTAVASSAVAEGEATFHYIMPPWPATARTSCTMMPVSIRQILLRSLPWSHLT